MKTIVKVVSCFGTLALLGALSGCASTTRGFKPVAVTRDPAAVQSCESLGNLKVPSGLQYSDPEKALLDLAYEKGANTLLVQSTEPPVGVAYRCSMPSNNATR
jgi:hypothetical protein